MKNLGDEGEEGFGVVLAEEGEVAGGGGQDGVSVTVAGSESTRPAAVSNASGGVSATAGAGAMS